MRMKLRPDTRNPWFYVWMAFIVVSFAGGFVGEAPSKLPLGEAAIMAALPLIVLPLGILAMCGMSMGTQRLTGHFKPWRRPALWTNPLNLQSLQLVVLVMVMVAAGTAGFLLRLPWGDFDAAVWGMVHLSGAAGLWFGLFLSLRFFGDGFEAAPGDSPQTAVNEG